MSKYYDKYYNMYLKNCNEAKEAAFPKTYVLRIKFGNTSVK